MFAKLIKDNQEKIQQLRLKKRNYTFFEDILKLHKIISFVGPRRVGKTYLMLQFILELIEKGIYKLEQIVFLDFSVFVGEKINPEDIIEAYYSLGQSEKPVLIFDEIQDIQNFTQLVLQFYTQGYQLFISGSNSKLLSSELATQFRGRVFQYFVYPLDFKEILSFNDISFSQVYSTKQVGQIKDIFKQILKYGNFPELVLINQPLLKTEILKTYFDILFYKDLVERYKVENESAMKFLIKRLILNNIKHINLLKIYNQIKSQGITLGKNTIYQYFEYLKNIFFVDELTNFYKKQNKSYLFNFGFGYLFGYTDNLGQNFENLIYWNLKKKFDKVYYKSNGMEIDFYLPGEDINIQVVYQLNENNFEREIESLEKQDGTKILVYFEKTGNFTAPNIEIIDFVEFLNKLWYK